VRLFLGLRFYMVYCTLQKASNDIIIRWGD
jgi:hypothetical protein